MSLFADFLPPARVEEMSWVLEGIFTVYLAGSFLWVLTRAIPRVRAAGSIDNAVAPPRWTMPPFRGWMFTVCVLGLLYLQSVLYMMVVVVGLGAFLLESRRTAAEQFGLRRIPAGRLVTWSVLVCGAVIFIELPLSQIVNEVMNARHLSHPEQEAVQQFRQVRTAPQIFSFLLQAVVLSPMMEELFFRGFLLTFLKNYASTWLALVLSAGVFAFAHLNLGSVVQLWVLGVVLGLAYEHGGSILLPMGIHACWNFMTALSLLVDRGSS